MCDFFKIDINQNGIGTDTADTFKGNDIFDFTSEYTAQPAGAWNNNGNDTSGAFIEINVNDTAENFTVTCIDDLFVAQITNPHKHLRTLIGL